MSGQVIYISGATNFFIYRLNIVTCKVTPVIQVDRGLTDISFHPDGTLYGISTAGGLYVIDTLTGNTNFIYQFGSAQRFNSLTTSADGILYSTGDLGRLYTYDKSTGIGMYLGLIGYSATGDLTFYKGNLYEAADNDRIILIDINNPPNSSIAVQGNIPGKIFGIVSYSSSCDSISCYAISNGNSVIYEINFVAKTLTPVCNLNITVGGGASTYEFYGSAPVIYNGVSSTNPSCSNNDGSFTISVSGGIAPITYSINGIDFQLSNTFDHLPSGQYQFVVKDFNGCSIIDEVSLVNPSAPVIENIAFVPATCGNSNGEIDISVNGGSGMIGYTIDGLNYQSSPVFTQLSSGEYIITVQDSAGCMAVDSIDIPVMPAVTIENIMATLVSCDVNQGSLTIDVQNGNGIQYSLDGINFQNANHFDQLMPSTYLVTIQDINGCRDTMSAVINPPVPINILSVTSIDPLCNINDGSLTIAASGGTGQIQYSLDGVNYQPQNNFAQLAPSSYTIYLKDENGCADTSLAVIHAGASPTLKNVTAESSLCELNNGVLIINAFGGTGNIQYSIDGVLFQNNNRFDSLAPMNYGISIRDQNGCIDTGFANIAKENNLFFGNVESHAPRCDMPSGSISIMSVGATGQVQYSINSLPFQSSNKFNDLSSGIYTVDIKDEAGCLARSIIEVAEPNALIIDAIESTPTACEELTGSINIHYSGGTGLLTVSFDGGPFQSVFSYQYLSGGDHLLSIADENGCQLDTIIRVAQKRCKIYIPNSFSPNQDNINDLFLLSTLDASNINVSKYMIFDRWGNMVYSANDFLMSDTQFWWDGTFHKMTMSPGVFAYYIEVKYEDGGSEIFKGDVTLVK